MVTLAFLFQSWYKSAYGCGGFGPQNSWCAPKNRAQVEFLDRANKGQEDALLMSLLLRAS
jgi:hypothetical protein